MKRCSVSERGIVRNIGRNVNHYSRGGVGSFVGGGVIVLPLTPLSTLVVCCACASTCGCAVATSVTAMVGVPVVGSFVVGLRVGSFVVCDMN